MWGALPLVTERVKTRNEKDRSGAYDHNRYGTINPGNPQLTDVHLAIIWSYHDTDHSSHLWPLQQSPRSHNQNLHNLATGCIYDGFAAFWYHRIILCDLPRQLLTGQWEKADSLYNSCDSLNGKKKKIIKSVTAHSNNPPGLAVEILVLIVVIRWELSALRFQEKLRLIFHLRRPFLESCVFGVRPDPKKLLGDHLAIVSGQVASKISWQYISIDLLKEGVKFIPMHKDLNMEGNGQDVSQRWRQGLILELLILLFFKIWFKFNI